MGILLLLAACLLLVVHVVLADVTVLKYVTVLYDRSPKLRIRGSGFTASSNDTRVTIGTSGGASLVLNEDITILKDEGITDGIVLKLMNNKRYESYENLFTVT
jgi:hypothetical protein